MLVPVTHAGYPNLCHSPSMTCCTSPLPLKSCKRQVHVDHHVFVKLLEEWYVYTAQACLMCYLPFWAPRCHGSRELTFGFLFTSITLSDWALNPQKADRQRNEDSYIELLDNELVLGLKCSFVELMEDEELMLIGRAWVYGLNCIRRRCKYNIASAMGYFLHNSLVSVIFYMYIPY